MSKASQRKEAERQKRLAKKGVDLALLKAVERKGPGAFADPMLFWKFVANSKSLGPQPAGANDNHPDRQKLETILKHHCETLIERLCQATENAGASGSDLPGMVIPCSLLGDRFDETFAVPLHPQTLSWQEGGDLGVMVRRIFAITDRYVLNRWTSGTPDALVWSFGLPVPAGEPTVCLGCTISGAFAARVRIDGGTWISATYPSQVWDTIAHEVGQCSLEGWRSSSMNAALDLSVAIDEFNKKRAERGITGSIGADDESLFEFFDATTNIFIGAQLDYMQLAIDLADANMSDDDRYEVEDEYEKRLALANKELLQVRQHHESLTSQLSNERQRSEALREELARVASTKAQDPSARIVRQLQERTSDYFENRGDI